MTKIDRWFSAIMDNAFFTSFALVGVENHSKPSSNWYETLNRLPLMIRTHHPVEDRKLATRQSRTKTALVYCDERDIRKEGKRVHKIQYQR